MSLNNFKTRFNPTKNGIISILFLTGAIVFFCLSLNAKKNSDLLRSEGIVIKGTVTEKRISTSDDYEDKYYIKYRYSYNYEKYTDENKVYHEFWKRQEINKKIPIRIQKSKPGNSQINSSLIFPESEDYKLTAFILLFISLIYIIIPYYQSRKKYFKERRKSIN